MKTGMISDMTANAKRKILIVAPEYLDYMGERKLPHAQELVEAAKRGVKIKPIIDAESHRIKAGVSVIDDLKARGIDVKVIPVTNEGIHTNKIVIGGQTTIGSVNSLTKPSSGTPISIENPQIDEAVLEQFNKDYQKAFGKQ